MKRSEMIKALQSRFCTSDVDAIADLADEIIDFLESKGMLPPACEKVVELDYKFGPTVDQVYCIRLVNEWEPE
jgi:hypothetical protein